MSFNNIILKDAAPERNYSYSAGGDDTDVMDEPEEITPLAELGVNETSVPAPEAVPPVAAPVAEVVPATTPATEVIAEKEITPLDWKAAIKTADKYEALKELGYDDFTIEMLKYKEQTGDYTPYLEVKTVDYSKVGDEQLLKMSLQKENPGMSDKALNFKFLKELSEKYYLDREQYPEDSDEAEYGQEQMRLDAQAKRQQFTEQQAKFKAPEAKPDTSAAEREQVKLQRQQKQTSLLLSSPVTKSLQAAKNITYGEGEDSFLYPVANIQPLIDQALNTITNSETTEFTPEELNSFYQSLAFAKDPKGFLAEYDKHRDSLAKKKLETELGNVTPIVSNVAPPPQNQRDYSYKTK